jgi:hypothetical protein
MSHNSFNPGFCDRLMPLQALLEQMSDGSGSRHTTTRRQPTRLAADQVRSGKRHNCQMV